MNKVVTSPCGLGTPYGVTKAYDMQKILCGGGMFTPQAAQKSLWPKFLSKIGYRKSIIGNWISEIEYQKLDKSIQKGLKEVCTR